MTSYRAMSDTNGTPTPSIDFRYVPSTDRSSQAKITQPITMKNRL
jgi:hypothetical protein